MSVAAPPRTSSRSRHLVESRPMRHPDASSRQIMTRRGWWLVALNFLVPGSAQVLAGSRRLGRFGLGATLTLWVLVVVAGVAASLSPSVALTIGMGAWVPAGMGWLQWLQLTLVQVALIGYVVLWAVLTIDTLRLVRLVKTGGLARFGIAVVSVLLLVFAGTGAATAATYVGSARDTITNLFGASAPIVPPSDGYYNVLLLGADSGEGRDSMRFDSISVVSINAETGETTITGIPRDMGHFPFAPGPMQERYPDGHEGRADPTCGWGSGINQLRTEVEVCQDGSVLYPAAVTAGSEPGIEATKDAAEGILGIEIPYYVFIDMHHFADLIDALGGVDIMVQERLPKGWGPTYTGQPAEDWAIGWIEAGPQHMDGDTAQWYARSRYTTDDFDRMRRQRELQTAMLAQFTPQAVLTRFQEIAAAAPDLVQTDLPQALVVPTLLDLALKARELTVNTIELTPEGGISETDPDYGYIQELVRTTLHPPTETPAPAS